MIEHRYKRPVRKLYSPGWYDRAHCRIAPGAVVLVTASWGPFRGIQTLTEPPVKDSCGRGSLVPVPHGKGGNG